MGASGNPEEDVDYDEWLNIASSGWNWNNRGIIIPQKKWLVCNLFKLICFLIGILYTTLELGKCCPY